MADAPLNPDIEWNERLEEYFASTGEKAYCLSWLHKKSESMFSHRTIFLDLPTIVIGAINGFLSVGSTQIFPGDSFASVYIGVVALFVSLLNTISSYFSWGRRAEGHRISSLQYAKLFHFLNIEMSLPQKERLTPSELLKYTKEAYDRLREISPLIPEPIIVEFRSEFKNENTISKPEEANGLEHIEIYKEKPIKIYKEKPVQIDKEKPVQIDKEKPVQIDKEKPIEIYKEKLIQIDKEKPIYIDPQIVGEIVREQSPSPSPSESPAMPVDNLVVEMLSLEEE